MNSGGLETPAGSQPHRSWRALWLLPVRSLGWLVLLLVLTASLIDFSGVAQNELQSELRRRLEPLGHGVSLDSVEIDWLGPGITLVNLRVIKDGKDHLQLDNLYIAADYSLDFGLHLARVHIDEGRLLISEDAFEDLRALMSATEDSSAPSEMDTRLLPSVQVRDLQVDMQDPDGRVLALGRVDFSMNSEVDLPARISGRVVLPSQVSASEDSSSRSTAVFLSGLLSPNGSLELHSITDGLDLAAWDMPALPAFDQIEALSPRGLLSLHTSGSVNLLEDSTPLVRIRARMEQGALQIPTVAAPITDVALELDLEYEPGPTQDVWTPRAWGGQAQLSAMLDGQALLMGARLGRLARPGLAFESWVQAPHFDCDMPTLRKITEPVLVPTIVNAFDPHGIVDASFGLTCAENVRAGTNPWPWMEFVVRVDERTPLRAAYHGWVDEDAPELRPIAYALPALVDDALVVVANQKRFPRHDIVDVRFAGTQPTGRVSGLYQMWSTPIDTPPFAPGFGETESDLLIVVPEIAIDAEVNRHLPELWEVPELATLYDDYGLGEAGEASVVVRLCSRSELPTGAVFVKVEARGLSAAYADIPAPAKNVNGLVTVVDDGRGHSCVSYAVRAELSSAKRLHVRGRVRSEGAAPMSETQPVRFDAFELSVDGLEARGSDVAVVASVLPDVASALKDFAPEGSIDMDYTRTSRAGESPLSWMEISPSDENFSVQPQLFPVRTGGIRGRVVAEIVEPITDPSAAHDSLKLEPLRSEVRFAPVFALWNGKVPLGMEASFPSDAAGEGWITGTGLRAADPDLLESLAKALDEDPETFFADLKRVDIGGGLDFNYHFEVPVAQEELKDSYEFRLRDLIIQKEGGFLIEGINGTLEMSASKLSASKLRVRLGSTPVDLRNVTFSMREGRVEAEADLRALDVVVDEILLSQFLDEQMVSSLVDKFGLQGILDLDQGHLRFELESGGKPRIDFNGSATISNAFIALGVPLSIRSAHLDLKQLIVQGDDVRGWGRLTDLYGQAVGRDLEQANLLLSYYDSQLTIEEMEGQFCRGRITGLSGSSDTGGARSSAPVLSVDLRPPHRFQAGLLLSDVQIQLLLEDVFASEIADRGYLNGHFHLRGELSNLLELRGSGHGQVTDSVLWSVPVIRDLFSQLGFDETAVFDEMESDFRIEGGKILMSGMQVHSPLLKLEGSGALGLDGTLSHDLEVRYSLVDKTGPLSGVIYWLQNRLLAIAVRGDMSRPKIILRGVFSNPFVSTEAIWRALPAPGFSPLPERF